jgi:hypothetical protein
LLDRRNWQDWGGRWARRNEFMRHLKTVLEELDVKYAMPVQPVVLPKSPFSAAPSSPDFRGMSGEDLGGNAAAFRGAERLYRSPSNLHLNA